MSVSRSGFDTTSDPPVNTASVKRNYLYNTLLLSANILFPLITFPYLTRVLGPEGIGRVQFVQAFSDYFRLFASLGIPLYGLRQIARVRNDRDELDRVFSEIVIVAFVANLIAFAVYLGAFLVVPKLRNEGSLVLLFGGYVFVNFLTLDWYFQGIEDYRFITLRGLLVKLAAVAVVFTCITESTDALVYGLVVSGSFIVANALNALASTRTARFRVRCVCPSRHLRGIFSSFLMAVIVKLYVGLDKIMLGFISGDEFVGYYALGDRIVRLLVVLVTSLSTVMIPRVSNLMENGNPEEVDRLLGTSVSFLLGLALPVTIGTVLLSPNLARLFGGEAFGPSVGSLRLLALMVLPTGVTSIAGLQILYAAGREREYIVSLLAASGTALLLNVLLIPSFRHVGAAGATAVASTVGAVLQVYFARAEVRGKVFTRGNLAIVGASVVMTVLLVALSFWTSFPRADLLKIVVAFVGGAAVYLLSLLVFGEPNVRSLLRALLARLGHRTGE